MTNDENFDMEYEQIKYNFLKLLKQFKIFDFDKFMKWLEKLVFDYQRNGYNVIENLEAEFHALNNNKKLQPITNDCKRQSIDSNENNNDKLNKIKEETNEANVPLNHHFNNYHQSALSQFQHQQQQQQQQSQHNSMSIPFGDIILPPQPPPVPHPPYRVFKTKINEHQISALEAIFKQKQYLNQVEKQKLSDFLQISPLQVKSWFKNRRYRQKKNETLMKAKQLEEQNGNGNLTHSENEGDLQTTEQNNINHNNDDDDDNDDSPNNEDDANINMTIDENDYDDCTSDESDNNHNNNSQENEDSQQQQQQEQQQQENDDSNLSSNDMDMDNSQVLSSPQSNQFKASFPNLSCMPSKNIIYKVASTYSSSHFSSSFHSARFTKAFNDELEEIFATQKYLSNTQRDLLAEKFRVPTTQITNWFQNKRRKLQRLERNKLLKAKNDSTNNATLNGNIVANTSAFLSEAAIAAVMNSSSSTQQFSTQTSFLSNALQNKPLIPKSTTNSK